MGLSTPKWDVDFACDEKLI